MHVDDRVLAPLRARFGDPAVLAWDGDVSEQEFRLASSNPARRHDVTVFVFNGERLALIRKPQYAPELWRPPGGGINPGEDFVAGTRREMVEELGIPVELDRYLVRTDARFRFGGEELEWATHVFAAHTDAEELAPQDTVEIAAARWGSLDELQGPIRERLLASGRALWRYRVALHDAAARQLRESSPS
jgi:8-oxo-dGTP pyrophosphatase MutT (NUDIX family)